MSAATDMLAAYIAAESAVLAGKEVRVGERSYKSEDLAEIRKGRKEWEGRVAAELGRASGARTIGGLSISHARLT